METISFHRDKEKIMFYKWGTALALITVFYNIVEGMVSVAFGIRDETIALFGFGLDSFVEVISGIGIWHMINRMRTNKSSNSDKFEQTALKVTGTAFYILAIGLTITAAVTLLKGHKPETALWGIIVAGVSILLMWILIHYKLKIGRRFQSEALLADAACSRACMYLSLVLLLSSVAYEVTGIGGFDSIGAIGIALFSLKEGREAFGKAKGKSICGCQGKCNTGT
jgi:divalent metal cation (Fe/Co/Zn/Cd) transporter